MSNTITIHTRKTEAIEWWMGQEYAAWEDSGKSDTHDYAILNRFGDKVTRRVEMSVEQAKSLIQSGRHWLSYQLDEIDADNEKRAIAIKRGIQNYITKIQTAINNV